MKCGLVDAPNDGGEHDVKLSMNWVSGRFHTVYIRFSVFDFYEAI